MQLDTVGCITLLTLEIVKEPDAGDGHRDIGILEIAVRRQHRIELASRVCDAGSKRAGRAYAVWIRDLSDHRAARAIAEDDMIVLIE